MEEQNTTIVTENTDAKVIIDNPGNDAVSLYKWQKRLLPFLVGMPTVLTIVFVVLTTKQVTDFNSKLNEQKTSEFIGTGIPSALNSAYTNNTEYIKWVTLVHMEQESIDKRYKQAGFLLMSRVLTKYLGFLTGMIMAIVGAAFIIGKLSESKTTMEGNFSEQVKFNIASSSPGILFGVLGTALMITTIITHSEISVQDQPLYLNANTIQFLGTGKTVRDSQDAQLINLSDLDTTDKIKK